MTPGLQPRPRAEVEAWLKEKAEKYNPDNTTDKLVRQWVESEMKMREKGGLVCNEPR